MVHVAKGKTFGPCSNPSLCRSVSHFVNFLFPLCSLSPNPDCLPHFYFFSSSFLATRDGRAAAGVGESSRGSACGAGGEYMAREVSTVVLKKQPPRSPSLFVICAVAVRVRVEGRGVASSVSWVLAPVNASSRRPFSWSSQSPESSHPSPFSATVASL